MEKAVNLPHLSADLKRSSAGCHKPRHTFLNQRELQGQILTTWWRYYGCRERCLVPGIQGPGQPGPLTLYREHLCTVKPLIAKGNRKLAGARDAMVTGVLHGYRNHDGLLRRNRQGMQGGCNLLAEGRKGFVSPVRVGWHLRTGGLLFGCRRLAPQRNSTGEHNKGNAECRSCPTGPGCPSTLPLLRRPRSVCFLHDCQIKSPFVFCLVRILGLSNQAVRTA